jgi:hypothetical protein
MINWAQVGEDFRQKYENCFCRYESPINKQIEVFRILQVEVNAKKGPDLTLFNERVGDLYLTYNTEAELDFTFPETGYFQGERMALMMSRRYERQWKKGLGDATIRIETPYDCVYPITSPYSPNTDFNLTEKQVKRMFPRPYLSITEGIKLLKDHIISVALSRRFAVGLGADEKTNWLWYDFAPIAEVVNGKIVMKVSQFTQEVKDYLRSSGDYVHSIV